MSNFSNTGLRRRNPFQLLDDTKDRGLLRIAGDFPERHPSELPGLVRKDKVGRLGMKDKPHVVVEVAFFLRICGNFVDVNVNGRREVKVYACKAGFLDSLSLGHAENIGASICMSAECHPPLELTVKVKEEAPFVWRQDESAAGDVARFVGSFEAIWRRSDEANEAINHLHFVGARGLVGCENC